MTNTSAAAIAYDELKGLIFNEDDVTDLLYAFASFKTDFQTIDAIIDRDSDHGRTVMGLLTTITADDDFMEGFND